MIENRNLKLEMERRLTPEVLVLIRHVAALASSKDIPLYLVGGPVRDLFLKRKILDIDLVMEGDAPSLARELAAELGGNVRIHSRFGTATYFSGNISIDLVTARSEVYPRPGALPVVKPGTITDDLHRRDFTINAMAVCLSPAQYGDLLDPYGGQVDLKRHLIKVIHPVSFIDDATRILRALRYEQRLAFQMEKETEILLRYNLAYLSTISGDRITGELELILQEERPENILQRAFNLGVLSSIHSSLHWNANLPDRFEHARSYTDNKMRRASLYFSLLAYDSTEKDNEDIIAFLKLPRLVAQAMRDTINLKANLINLAQNNLPRSKIYHLLRYYSLEALITVDISANIPAVHEYIQLFLTELRHNKVALNGKDLLKLGIKPGPVMGDILEILMEARLDGRVSTSQQEIELVEKLIDMKE